MTSGLKTWRNTISPQLMDCPSLSVEDLEFSVTASLEQFSDDAKQSNLASSEAALSSRTQLLAAGALARNPQEMASGTQRVSPLPHTRGPHENGGGAPEFLSGADTASLVSNMWPRNTGVVQRTKSTLRAPPTPPLPPHENGGDGSESLSGADAVVVGGMSPRTPKILGGRVRPSHGSSFVPRADRSINLSHSDREALAAWKSTDETPSLTSTSGLGKKCLGRSKSLIFGVDDDKNRVCAASSPRSAASRGSHPASCPVSVAPAKRYDLQQNPVSSPRGGLVLGSSHRKALHREECSTNLGRVSICQTVPRSSATIQARRRLNSSERPLDFAVEGVRNLAAYDASMLSLVEEDSAERWQLARQRQLEFHSCGGNHHREMLRGSDQSQSPTRAPRLPTKIKNANDMAVGMAARGPFSPNGPAEEVVDADPDNHSFRTLMKSFDRLRSELPAESIEKGDDPELNEMFDVLRQHSVDVKWLAQRVAKKCITKGMIERVAATLPQDGKKISQAAQEQSQQLVAQAMRFLSSEEDVALRGFKLAVQRNPLLVSALLRIGKIKMRAGELQSSRLYMERAFVLNPGNPECVLGYADVLLALGDSYGALRVYEAIVSDFSKSEAVSDQLKDAKEVDAGFKIYLDSLASCGLLYYKLHGDIKSAEEACSIVCSVQPMNARAIDASCAMLVSGGFFMEAAKLHRAMCERHSDHMSRSCPYFESLFPIESNILHAQKDVLKEIENLVVPFDDESCLGSEVASSMDRDDNTSTNIGATRDELSLQLDARRTSDRSAASSTYGGALSPSPYGALTPVNLPGKMSVTQELECLERLYATVSNSQDGGPQTDSGPPSIVEETSKMPTRAVAVSPVTAADREFESDRLDVAYQNDLKTSNWRVMAAACMPCIFG